MPSKVLCTVDNCHYWSQGNECVASEILVTSDLFANYAPDNIDATTASTLSATPTANCRETACKTFVGDNEPRATKRADNVTKGESMQGKVQS